MLFALVTTAYLALAAFLLPFFAYLALVTGSALVNRRRQLALGSTTRFTVVIPAHNEQENIAATVVSCRSMRYDPSLFVVLVIADNCDDATAEVARAAGADVIERFDPARRSKGFALEDVLNEVALKGTDAVIVVDADSIVDPDLLSSFAGTLALGYDWVQCYDTVGNPDASWRTRLMTHAFSLSNGVSLLGQEGLGLGAGLKGNGMCFSVVGLRRVPWQASGLAEDMEFSWKLHMAGERIHFLPQARVYAEMVSRGGKVAAAQRRRWEAGRRGIPRTYLMPLLKSPKIGCYRKFLYTLQMTIPSLVTLAAGLLVATSVHPLSWGAPSLIETSRLLVPLHLLMAMILLAYVVSPVLVMGLPARYLLDLAIVPYYMAWKLAVTVGRAPTTWVRTQRQCSNNPQGPSDARTGESIHSVDGATA